MGESPTTSYGTWVTYAKSLSVEDTVTDFIHGGGGAWADEMRNSGNFQAIVDEFRAEINKNLPGGVTLHGNDFYGPYPLEDGVCPDELNELISDVIDGIDLSRIVMDHDPTIAND